jgi:hypothetical protein
VAGLRDHGNELLSEGVLTSQKAAFPSQFSG